MGQLVAKFISRYFQKEAAAMGPDFIEGVTMVVNSHRHKKGEEFVQRSRLDYGIVRDTMYKYSKQVQARFMNVKEFAFLFVWFADSENGRIFMREKFREKEEEYVERMEWELAELREEAAKTINR